MPATPEIAALMPEERVGTSTWATPRTVDWGMDRKTLYLNRLREYFGRLFLDAQNAFVTYAHHEIFGGCCGTTVTCNVNNLTNKG